MKRLRARQSAGGTGGVGEGTGAVGLKVGRFKVRAMTDSRKRVLYLLLPCVLAFAAMFLNGLFKPEFHWQVRLLESLLEPYQIEGLGEQIGPLFAGPDVRPVNPFTCVGTDIRYVQNKLQQDKLTIEGMVTLNNGFATWVVVLAVLQVVGYMFYLLTQKLGWRASIVIFLLLFFIVELVFITVSGPLGPLRSGGVLSCVMDGTVGIKVEAELMSISLDGIFYPFIGAFLNSVAVVLMIKFYRLPMPASQQTENEDNAGLKRF